MNSCLKGPQNYSITYNNCCNYTETYRASFGSKISMLSFVWVHSSCNSWWVVSPNCHCMRGRRYGGDGVGSPTMLNEESCDNRCLSLSLSLFRWIYLFFIVKEKVVRLILNNFLFDQKTDKGFLSFGSGRGTENSVFVSHWNNYKLWVWIMHQHPQYIL